MNKLLNRMAEFLATFFYLGYIPVAPGTVGALAGLCWWLILSRLGGDFIPTRIGDTGWGFVIFLILFFLVGVWSSGRFSRVLGKEDPASAVIDETFSIFVTFYALQLPAPNYGWIFLLLGLLLNRVFDIFKPTPIRELERVKGGWGIMLDDLAAGIYSNLALRLILFLTV